MQEPTTIAARLDQLLASTPEDHEDGRRLAWLREKLGIDAAPAGKLKPPIISVAGTRAELAKWRNAELPRLVAVVINRFRVQGDPEEVCQAYAPSLTAVLGAWWDEHFVCGEALPPEPTAYEKALAEMNAGKGDEPAD
jgi:hypothetical protein